MGLPGGSRLEATNATSREHQRNAGQSGEVKVPSARIRIHGLLFQGERPSGAGSVWLGTGNGGGTVYPLSTRSESDGPNAGPARRGDDENADEETLDAACWLMPGLPRDLIAEALEPGPYRGGADGS